MQKSSIVDADWVLNTPLLKNVTILEVKTNSLLKQHLLGSKYTSVKECHYSGSKNKFIKQHLLKKIIIKNSSSTFLVLVFTLNTWYWKRIYANFSFFLYSITYYYCFGNESSRCFRGQTSSVSVIFLQYIRVTSKINPLSANPTKWSKTLKQIISKLLINCLSVFDHFVGLALKGWNMLYFKRIPREIVLQYFH